MLIAPNAVKIFLCVKPTDMRCSFSALSGLVRSQMGGDPLSGHFFIFRNHRGDRLKILYWEKDGYALWYKQLQRGTFKFPDDLDVDSLEIDTASLSMLLEGIDLRLVHRQKRFRLQKQPALC